MNTFLHATWRTLLLGIVVLAFSCGDDGDVKQADLLGRWEITQAMRAGKVTTTMDQMYFDFKEEGTLTTNMTGQEEDYQFELAGNKIQQREGIVEADYEIVHFATDSLVLRSTIRQQLFQLTLRQVD